MDRRLDTFRIGMMASNLPNLSLRLSVPLTLEPAPFPARADDIARWELMSP